MAAWLVLTALRRPATSGMGWPVALLDLAALVAVPLVLRALPPSRPGPARAWAVAVLLQPPAALLLAATSAIAAGGWALAGALPWIGVTALLALYGVARVWTRRGGPAWALAVDAGLVFVAVGGGWTALHRLGVRPIGFSPVIVLLTAVHFHFAGLLLPVATGLAGARTRGWMARAAAWGVIIGVPLTAVGITATQRALPPWIEASAVIVTVVGGWMAALLHLRLAARGGVRPVVRALWMVAGLSLAAGMTLALLYGVRVYRPVPLLTIPWMQAVHGSLNALGFGVAAMLGWALASPDDGGG